MTRKRRPRARQVLFLAVLIAPFVAWRVVDKNTTTLHSKPAGAVVYVNGKNLGRTPVELKMDDAKEMEITLELQGFESEQFKAKELKSMNSRTIYIKLNRAQLSLLNPYRLDLPHVPTNPSQMNAAPLRFSTANNTQSHVLMTR